jgi:hypothetical protein
MARGDLPFNRLELNLQPIHRRRTRVRAEVGVPLNDRRPGAPTCRSEKGNFSTASTESPPENDIVLVDSAEVALGVQHAFSAKVRAVRLAVSVSRPGAWKFRWSRAVLRESMPPSDVRGAISH